MKQTSEETQFSVRSLYPTDTVPLSEQELKDVEAAFPPIDFGFLPSGNRVLVQLRSLEEKTRGGIFLPQQSQEGALYEEQIGRVVAIGRSAFYNQSTMEPWPEGEDFTVGDFVRVPKFGGDKTWTETPDGRKALFVIFRDRDIIGRITGNPLKIKGYI
jgi:co-chaperonin GroES (HSP10)